MDNYKLFLEQKLLQISEYYDKFDKFYLDLSYTDTYFIKGIPSEKYANWIYNSEKPMIVAVITVQNDFISLKTYVEIEQYLTDFCLTLMKDIKAGLI